MNTILFDDPALRANLLPLTFTRPVAQIRIGILTIAEKWSKYAQGEVYYLTQGYLQGKFNQPLGPGPHLYLNGAVCPTAPLWEQIQQLPAGGSLFCEDLLVALNAGEQELSTIEEVYQLAASGDKAQVELLPHGVVRQLWEIFRWNGPQIREDFQLVTQGRVSQPITDPFTVAYNPENIFIEEGAQFKAAILNAENGPIYIGKNAQVQEGTVIRGPFAICQESIINMGGKMRGDVTVGPYCKVGGEISNCVFFGHSNKGHDGFLGNSVVGEWCNFGADSNTSNLKNNYSKVRLWSHAQEKFVDTGLQFCGLIMADHAKTGINTMFNTGTVVGVGANVFGAGYPPTFVPSFTWGGGTELQTFRLPKFYEVVEAVVNRRGMTVTAEDRRIYDYIFEETQRGRTWEAEPLGTTA
ncbi:GlmU family protein [Rufibacter glacialis]|uniref:GlmU family protein n=1 Tax=Rufibacter glacialis TaxID=1259555 RepID=A0A5M8QRC2_9BACT|nr:GlmU family protein [Rufibacter glacialis]KAA6437544.1 glucose-1-phosphate thymidylyltransferase [Rufibacter glacialis]GGK58423.1 glucose-1-phosphate thymidylyltransferase [Rufibacter glacialis]